MNKILILGASGFIGNSLYRELLSYFDLYGTYCHDNHELSNNQVFFQYNVEEDSVLDILETVKPNIIISAIKGGYRFQLLAYKEICLYINKSSNCQLLFISSSEVFDAKTEFPSYEKDKPLAQSDLGKFKISIEKLLLDQIPDQCVILRLPIVLGVQSPIVLQLRKADEHRAVFEVKPNLIVSVTTANKLAQQVHYIINKELKGIFHLASKDMIHHEELFREISSKLGLKNPIFKSVFSRNDDHYLAILPKYNKLPKNYRINISEVIEESTLLEEIVTIKK